MTDGTYSYDRLHREVTGPERGSPVLLLHGWGSSAKLMRPLAQALAGTFRVYNIDLPGHGLSPEPPVPWGVPEHAALLRSFLDELVLPAHNGEPVSIVGHSNGGRISLYMAGDADLGRKIGRLALISPSGIPPVRTWKYHLRKNVATILKAPFQILPEKPREFGLDWLKHSLVWKLLGSSDYSSLSGVMRDTFVKTVNCFVDDRLNRIRVPVLLLWGDRDEAISLYQMQVLEKNIPDAGLVVLEEAGHYGYLDDPDTALAAIEHFLQEVAETERAIAENGGTSV